MEAITCVGVLGWRPPEPLGIKKSSSLMWEAGHGKLPLLWISHKKRSYNILCIKIVNLFALTHIDLIDPTSVLHNQ